ncbi:MAG: tyrosine--tRNA ligase [Candidatus Dojkabacteria bacterium]|nr:MAG: tyrosine--tRNA ligase [Candidatus Dojkabacteria bacterium]
MKSEMHEVKKDKEIIDLILDKAVEEILPSREALEAALMSGKRLKVYIGIDPTADTLHIGHTVSMRRLEYFRQLGHEAILLIGDFTARIGDPDKKDTRSQLTAEQVADNLKLYTEQAKAIIKIDDEWNPVKVLFNNDWLGQMKFGDVVQLASNFTVQQMLKRDLFQKRIAEDKPLYVHEFFYPMMQGWDSVAMDIDVEIGGNDQLFNMLAGRQLVQTHLKKEKFVVAGKLLTTADGTKMGKSEGNMVKLSDSAEEIYGKIMALPDSSIVQGFELLTDSSMERVRETENSLGGSDANPLQYKKMLALEVTSALKGDEAAKRAEQYFVSVFQEKNYEVDIPTVKVDSQTINILALIVDGAKFAESKSQARRLVEQGAVYFANEKISDWNHEVTVNAEGAVLKVGRQVANITTA